MKSYEISQSILNMAQTQLAKTPIWKGSHRGADANQVGVLGELIVEQWLKDNGISFFDDRKATTHDYTLKDGKTFDVKTKDRTIKPRASDDCSVPLYNHEHQRPDYYIFVSLQRAKGDDSSDLTRFHTAHILGGMNLEQLDSLGVIWKAGQIDPSNNMKFWTDCKNVKVEQLASPKIVKDKWRLA
ncbi:hypothetical protein FM038_003325 [Shewanella eurypsychrophilus]|uniref:Uncharacterized protein n=1 Tax=Shewanella eurypsychrophilus TaxID=2593656 RepID=A0ABX6V211_9GAMM|nr:MULTISPECIES: hypothetical protein [Shewanella]QFU21270.1 hypothetical protein FS418_04905 [Shewanella sp. YLB-09]QPG56561.1 hypothetical protein FM038_003325 [Shewanella eurypsychrophilus]